MSQDHEHEHEHEPVGYGQYFVTWIALIVLTGLTVTAAGMNFGGFGVLVALLIATVKATIVLQLFMHLKYESPLFHRILLVTIVMLAVMLGLTYVDTIFR